MRGKNAKVLQLLSFAVLFGTCSALAQSEVAPGIQLIRGRFVPGTQPDGNTVIFAAPDGLVVMDTGRHAQHTQTLLDFAAAEKAPIAAVVNSHWHLDHIGGNALVRRAFPKVTIYASDALAEARTGFLANYHRQLEEMIVAKTTAPDAASRFRTELALIDDAAHLAPDVVIDAPGVRKIAEREFEVGLERYAVTAGDVWLFDRQSGVLASGDLVTLPAPFLDTACAPRWKESLDRIGRKNFELLIPGHGPPLTHRQFDVYRAAFGSLLQCAGSDATKASCIDGWINGIAPLIRPDEQAFTRSLMDYYVDVLRKPAAEAAKLCKG
jgi:glyoxylase-like metal-dependent hydrolase (beta-lactamase superfamily II)